MLTVNKINPNITFKGNIIDSHSHIIKEWSPDQVVFSDNALDEVIKDKFEINVNGKKDFDEVKYAIVSNTDCIDMKAGIPVADEIKGNQKMLTAAQKNLKMKPIAVCQPKYGSAENIEKLLTENPNKFVGLKFHPQMLNVAANNSEYDEYMTLAEKHNLPCLFHSDAIGSASDPKFIYELGKRHPNVAIILGHLGMGGTQSHDNAINVLKESIENGDAKLYADFAWTDLGSIKKVIEELKNTSKGDFTSRLLFGTDAPLGEFNDPRDWKKIPNYYGKRVSEIKSMIETEFKSDSKTLTENIFYKNSADLFKLDAKDVVTKTAEKSTKNGNKTLKYVAFGALFALGLAGIINQSTKHKAKPNIAQKQ